MVLQDLHLDESRPLDESGIGLNVTTSTELVLQSPMEKTLKTSVGRYLTKIQYQGFRVS